MAIVYVYVRRESCEYDKVYEAFKKCTEYYKSEVPPKVRKLILFFFKICIFFSERSAILEAFMSILKMYVKPHQKELADEMELH
jgi:hypothetical protein